MSIRAVVLNKEENTSTTTSSSSIYSLFTLLISLPIFIACILYNIILCVFTDWILTFLPLESSKAKFPLREQSTPPVIVITGCDTGFGRILALRMYKKGFKVIACCYSKASIEGLFREGKYSEFLCPIELDVTDSDACKKAAKEIESKHLGPDKGIYALVNNAGISKGGYTDFTPNSIFEQVMAVNFFGIVNMCEAFLPLLKKTSSTFPNGARVVNMTSISGRIPGVGMNAYTSSKHAAEAYSDVLRKELKMWNIKVCILESWFAATSIISQDPFIACLDQFFKYNPHSSDYNRAYFKGQSDAASEIIDLVAIDPSRVVDAYESALCQKYPKHRYIIGEMGKFVAYVMNILPTFISDAFESVKDVPLFNRNGPPLKKMC